MQLLAEADKKIVSLQKALAAAELKLGNAANGQAITGASALDGDVAGKPADGLNNATSVEASTWDQLAAEVM